MIEALQLISTAMTITKSSIDLGKSALGKIKEEAAKEAVMELMEKLYETKTKIIESQDKVEEMSRQIADLKSQLKEALATREQLSNYRLVDVGGAKLYRIKAELVASGESDHHICPNCYINNKWSPLQWGNPLQPWCANCKSWFAIAPKLPIS